MDTNLDKTKIAVEVFDINAQLYQEKFMDVSQYAESLDIFGAHLPASGGKVLDLACGPGNMSKYLLEKQPNLHVLATDLSQNMLNLAKKNNPMADVQLLDCRDIWRLTPSYHGIVCAFAFPYIPKEEVIQMIKDMSLILEKGGVVFLSTMEDDYEKSRWQKPSSGEGQGAYTHYHEAGYLLQALSDNNFEVLFTDRKHYEHPPGTPTTDLILVAKKQG